MSLRDALTAVRQTLMPAGASTARLERRTRQRQREAAEARGGAAEALYS
jgi:hypothetical protein